jgi:hypothetical protein
VVFKSVQQVAIKLFGVVVLGIDCPAQHPAPGAASNDINPFVEITKLVYVLP